jgi:hypothetical protein
MTRVRRRIVPALAAALCLPAAAPPAVLADADPGGVPSARELWESYPLEQPGAGAHGASAGPSQADGAGPARSTPATRQNGSGDGWPGLAMLVAATVAIAGGATLWLLRRRPPGESAGTRAPAVAARILPHPPQVATAAGSPPPEAAKTVATGPRPLTASAARDPDRSPRGPRLPARQRSPASRETGPRPPDPARAWTAEVEWRDTPGGPRFCAVARDERNGGETIVAETGPLEWPPRGPAAVQSLAASIFRLSRTMQDAGWSPLAHEGAWYAKRFEWKPAAARRSPERPPAAAPAEAVDSSQPSKRTGRFDRPWPEDLKALWRCEIQWNAGWASSRFEAVAHAPHGVRGEPIAASKPFRWMLRRVPDLRDAPARGAVEELRTLLVTDGWTLLRSGPQWYSHRLVWRREGTPPNHLERAHGDTVGTS